MTVVNSHFVPLRGCLACETLRSLRRSGGARMQPLSNRGVPNLERDVPTADWDSVRIFLEVARRGSFRSAAEHLGQSINGLRRRIAELEQQLGLTLFTRHVDGVRITAEA